MRFHDTLPLVALFLGLPAARAATLEGTVADNATGRPLARCQVNLAGLQNGYELPLKTLLSDSAGRFRFDGLTQGTYLLAARRAGYQTARYGQKRWDGAAAPIVLSASSTFSVELRLQRMGAVAGTVLDENQIGLSGNTVTAYEAGSRPLRIAASAVSDDRGVYRIAGLAPGTYYIRTGPQTLEDKRGLLPTFFGQPAGAPAAVSVELDRDTGPIEIQPQAGDLGYLNGRITGAAMSWVWLFSETGTRQAIPHGAGEFTIDQLAPGDYEILAGGGSAVAYRKLRIQSGANQVTLAAGAMPLVRVRFEDIDTKPIDLPQATISLERKSFSERLPVAQPFAALTGAGVLPVLPGDYAAVVQAARECYVRSIRVQDSGESNAVEALPGQAVELTVVLGSKPAALSGKVTLAGQAIAGAPVFLDALDSELRMRIGGTRSARADGSGAYGFAGLPPGSYQVFSSFEFLSPSQADFKRVPVKVVTIHEGGRATLDLDLFGSM